MNILADNRIPFASGAALRSLTVETGVHGVHVVISDGSIELMAQELLTRLYHGKR